MYIEWHFNLLRIEQFKLNQNVRYPLPLPTNFKIIRLKLQMTNQQTSLIPFQSFNFQQNDD